MLVDEGKHSSVKGCSLFDVDGVTALEIDDLDVADRVAHVVEGLLERLLPTAVDEQRGGSEFCHLIDRAPRVSMAGDQPHHVQWCGISGSNETVLDRLWEPAGVDRVDADVSRRRDLVRDDLADSGPGNTECSPRVGEDQTEHLLWMRQRVPSGNGATEGLPTDPPAVDVVLRTDAFEL